MAEKRNKGMAESPAAGPAQPETVQATHVPAAQNADAKDEDSGERPSGHEIVPKVPAKQAKIKSAKDVRSSVLQWAKKALAERKLEIARGGMGTDPDRLDERLNKTTGFWLDSGENQKPVRWIFHVVPSTKGPKAIWPSQPTYRYMGIVGANDRKAVLTYRLIPLFKVAEGKYATHFGWEWLVWFATKYPLNKALGNSAPVKNLSFEKEEVYIAGQRFPVIAGGIVGFCKPDDEVSLEGFKDPVKYGDLTKELHGLVAKLGTAEQPEATFITAASAPVEAPKA